MSTDLFHFERFESYSPFTQVGPYRASDYWKLPEGTPVELVRGRLIMSPSPTTLHQTLVSLLSRILHRAEDLADGLMFVSPMDVVFSDDTILQPDLIYIAKGRRNIVRNRIEGVPDLVIEIISFGSDRRDRTEKLDLYSKYGVAEYWIVDPESKLIEFLLLDNSHYLHLQPTNDCYQSPRLPEIEIELSKFWREVDRKTSQC